MTKPSKLVVDLFFQLQVIFQLFFKYWDICSKRDIEYSSLQVMLITTELFSLLKVEWDRNDWNINELYCICHALENNNEDINPNLFFGKELSYLDFLKSWYYLETADD